MLEILKITHKNCWGKSQEEGLKAIINEVEKQLNTDKNIFH